MSPKNRGVALMNGYVRIANRERHHAPRSLPLLSSRPPYPRPPPPSPPTASAIPATAVVGHDQHALGRL